MAESRRLTSQDSSEGFVFCRTSRRLKWCGCSYCTVALALPLQERTTPQSSLLPNDSPNLQLRLLTSKEASRVSIPQSPTLCRYTRREIYLFSAH
ncbi:hypothetical protein AUEXF2481DRAFT_665215 [Aureobasidium subglaciale EXF-2481]|uniref:Uncharacterized protein n=1 Tax=Aureobasidium subglaciale (strain EXF-2481) TaxID=1043005 RepID=A0A074YQ36_AURSE|nr:uncharacterized protein AUEXF2481DRAFT_665215 [Aureobasidium subglaciale EXF-2481]KEQ96152.1 hypothetical protein AUEXF2481DRAFT_665215 [Aureobasidium subglaciale EXF-2481]